jgi:hypothetical protein
LAVVTVRLVEPVRPPASLAEIVSVRLPSATTRESIGTALPATVEPGGCRFRATPCDVLDRGRDPAGDDPAAEDPRRHRRVLTRSRRLSGDRASMSDLQGHRVAIPAPPGVGTPAVRAGAPDVGLRRRAR